MKTTTKNIGLLSVAITAISLGAVFAFMEFNSIEADNSSLSSTSALMQGHVTAVVKDKETHAIKAYRQSDNAIVLTGMGVLANQIFHMDTGCPSCNSGGNMSTGPVRWMHIGNGSAAPAFTDTVITDLESQGRPSCTRLDATVYNSTAADTSPPTSRAQINVTAVAEFDGAVCNSNDIQEAGIFNHPTDGSGEMFARNTFGNVDLTTSDRLELTWLFTFTDQ